MKKLTENIKHTAKIILIFISALAIFVSTFAGMAFARYTDSTEYSSYVSALSVEVTADGTAAFNTEEGDGKDTSESNGIVRTFDTVSYTLYATFASISDTYEATKATLNFQSTLDMQPTEAEFNMNEMNWLASDWVIEYLDAKGNVYGTVDSGCGDGEFYLINSDGSKTKTSLNSVAAGSDKGSESYLLDSVTTQRLTGKIALKGTVSQKNVVPGSQSLTTGIKVLNAKNGQKVEPSFKVWLDNNFENYGFAKNVTDKTNLTPTPQNANCVSANGEYGVDTNYSVTVTAGAFYNVEIQNNAYLLYRSWFDFSTGSELKSSSTAKYTVGGESVSAADIYSLLEALGTLKENYGKSSPQDYTNNENNETVNTLLGGHTLDDYSKIFSNIKYGRMYSYGIDLQLENIDASGDYGMKGLSLPQGDITFDLSVSTTAASADKAVDTSQFYSILWDYEINNYKNSGKLKRTMRWNNNSNTTVARAAVPFNSGTGNTGCYNGGDWALTGIDDGTLKSSADTANGAVCSFNVSGYDFDLNDYTFPKNKAVNSGSYTPYVTYQYCFSAGQAQVLSVFPRVNSGTVDAKQKLTVGNISVKTISGQALSKEQSSQSDKIKYDYETNTRGNDNVYQANVTFYTPGTMSKNNSFVRRKSNSSANEYLGQTGTSDTYWVCDYDSTAYIGDKIAIFSTCYISDASDSEICAYNLLQLFDSYAISVDVDNSSTATGNSLNGVKNYLDRIMILQRSGKYKSSQILYAADPDFKDGYNTNDKTVYKTDKGNYTIAKYMNLVRESDLIYFESLDELEAAGYSCIGVLAEVRGCTGIMNGYDFGYCGLKIPIKVNDRSDSIGKTVGTVNSATIWSTQGAMDGVSWKDGKWDEKTGKNVLKNYITISSSGNSVGYYKDNGNGSSGYVKAEFADGTVVNGTPRGGKLYGSTLMVMGYKASIKIDSEKDEGEKSYNISKDENAVTYTLSNIQTEITSNAQTSQDAVTDLQIKVNLKAKDSKQNAVEKADVTILNGLYTVKVGDEEVKLSQDKENPTEIAYEKGGKEYTLKIYIDTPSADGKSFNVYISGAPVDCVLPNITAHAQLGNSLPNGTNITATATITGTGDQRAYEEINGNVSNDTINIINLGSSALTKSVDKELIELSDNFTYKISYSNKSTTVLDGKAYFYDVLPYNNDIRGTDYTMPDGEGADDGTYLTKIYANSHFSDGTESEFDTNIKIYYSTVKGEELTEKMQSYNSSSADEIEEMLSEDTGLFSVLGTISAGSTSLTIDKNLQTDISCIYAVAEGLGANENLNIYFDMDTSGNAAADIYGNLARGFVPSKGNTLRTVIVQTAVISRSISGKVWLDKNLNGVYDSGEELLENVTCALFKQSDSGQYEPCSETVDGRQISPIVTGSDGAYSFTGLASGKYIVAFSLPSEYSKKINGATLYQVNGENDETSNDGVSLKKTAGKLDTETAAYSGIPDEYDYVIEYSAKEQYCLLHTLDEYEEDLSLLNHYKEEYENQDLGLCGSKPAPLPQAGGSGTQIYYAIGGATILFAFYILVRRHSSAKRLNERGTNK